MPFTYEVPMYMSSAGSDVRPEAMMNAFESYASRALNGAAAGSGA